MNEGIPRSIMSETNIQRRRSERLVSSPNVQSDNNKMAQKAVAVKRITMRKIAPRKTVAPSEHNKENTPRRSRSEVEEENSGQKKKPKISTPGPTSREGRDTRSTSAERKKRDAVKLSPILPSTPGSSTHGRGTRSTSSSAEKKKQKAALPSPTFPSTPGPITQGRSTRSTSAEKKKQKVVMPSPILPSTPPPASQPPQPAVVDPEDAVWSQKVRRSYSRLSDRSFNSPQDSRETLFGFEKLTTPEVVHRPGRTKKGGLEVSVASLSGLNSFSSLLEGEDCGVSVVPEVDTNIPGVAVVKEKRKRRKVQQINSTEMDALAAKMNAEFEEAEVFELVVE